MSPTMMVLEAVLIAAAVLAQPPAAASAEGREPPYLFFLEAEGARVPVELDKPFSAAALGSKLVSLRMEPHRQFQAAGVAFQFPREFSFQADLESESLSLWTMSGSTARVSVQRHRGNPAADKVLKNTTAGILKAFGAAKKGLAAAEGLELRVPSVQARRVVVELGSSSVVQDVYAWTWGEDTVVLIVQDSPVRGKPSAEGERVRALLKSSLRVLPAPPPPAVDAGAP